MCRGSEKADTRCLRSGNRGRGVERTERSGGLEERRRRENMRDRTLCHFVSMCPLKGMSQWTDKQQNSRVTPLSIKRLFLLLARTLFHSLCKLYTQASDCTISCMSLFLVETLAPYECSTWAGPQSTCSATKYFNYWMANASYVDVIVQTEFEHPSTVRNSVWRIVWICANTTCSLEPITKEKEKKNRAKHNAALTHSAVQLDQ